MLRFGLLSLVILGGCTVGDPEPLTGGDAPDAGTSPQDSGDPAPDGPAVACEDTQAIIPDGNHNAGASCLTCHNGTTAPQWTLAGTLYTSPAGAAPQPGATIIVTDANGTEVKIPTANNGNFWTTTKLTFPVTVAASECPNTEAMTAQVQVGDCNSCHTGGGNGRIYLP
jgi:hypothetical protein